MGQVTVREGHEIQRFDEVNVAVCAKLGQHGLGDWLKALITGLTCA
jgi:hypothetical protein